jgi:hypothetical protein
MVRFRDGVPRSKLGGQLVWFLAWVGITGFGLFLTASRELHGTHQQLGLPPCPSVAFFDRPCFGCGMTTSITSLLHFDFATSLRAHPFGLPFYILFTISALMCGYGFFKGKYLDTDDRRFNRAMMVITLLFVTFGVARFVLVKYNSPDFLISRAARD